jgi:hypothetical protein
MKPTIILDNGTLMEIEPYLGVKYSGEWKQGRRDGKGTQVWPDGNLALLY